MAKNLATHFYEAELAAGKTPQRIMEEMSKATGYKVDYSHVNRWKAAERSPRPEARRYMLGKVLPELLNRATQWKNLTPAERRALIEALI